MRKLKATSPGSHRKSQLGLELMQLDSRSPPLNYRGLRSLSTQSITIQITMIKTVLTYLMKNSRIENSVSLMIPMTHMCICMSLCIFKYLERKYTYYMQVVVGL